ncbi:MAG: hypothetical protein JOZ29_20320 [Deltaproteobacteria bacterium]|nr:hypothetical protein [Deltaproteobacteria bacterium]MBV8454593.1 hypothetical protein [Deltaproteobacteria bacterium]
MCKPIIRSCENLHEPPRFADYFKIAVAATRVVDAEVPGNDVIGAEQAAIDKEMRQVDDG